MHYSPRIITPYKFPYLRQQSSFSSNVQTETSSGISRHDIKNINILKKSMNSYSRKRNISGDNFITKFIRQQKSSLPKKKFIIFEIKN